MSGAPIRSLRQDLGERPFLVIWEVTRACELVCRHCRADAVPHRSPLELDTDDGRAMLDDLADLGSPRPIVVLTGGDPFQRPDLADLVAHGTSRNLTMALSPSVTPRLTPAVLRELRDAGAKAVSLSLDGATASTHDGFRRVAGVFDQTLVAARAVRELGFRLQINTTVTAGNVHELPAILRHVLDLEATLWSVFFLVPTGRGAMLGALDADGSEEVLHWLHDVSGYVPVKSTEAPHFRRIALQRAQAADVDASFPPGPLRQALRAETQQLLGDHPRRPQGARPPLDINAGRGFVFVDHHGAVFPSGFLPVAAGSVRERPLSEIYRQSPLLQALRDPEALGGRCGRCEFRAVCGGSRSQAFAASGDALGEDPMCAHVPAVPVGAPARR
ncbi:MAG TPA: TIGR04053 family radical SAM/SPASM domain-containing protein [Acidimicrobiales bacterium]|nr:TIGR04053 family radical SAM/SPASM domain-containing protein [Acidimicrobiales bacterium]